MKATTNWTVADIPNLAGRTAVVTGANSGVGFETAVELARRGATTILACRSVPRGERAISKIHALIPSADARLMALDLADLSSIDQFAENLCVDHDHLSLLVNNAGIMATPHRETVDGFELQIGTNHLGPFALTAKLMPALLNASAARVVNVSSIAHRDETIDTQALNPDPNGYNRWRAYGRSKLANLLFTYELQRRLESASIEHVAAIAAHPGVSKTNIAQGYGIVAQIFMPFVGLFLQSAKMGALPTLRAATDPSAKGAQYYGPDGPKERRGYPVIVSSTPESHDENVARLLWERSEELTGVKFEI
ncbi:MAG: SDR family NAD(P)-dependent oxidoreductase [Chloroflexi bacterium]|nr:SDR family NAD(P)-dependent oxidoreductase [Chloroflexota bacterium]